MIALENSAIVQTHCIFLDYVFISALKTYIIFPPNLVISKLIN